MSAEKSTARDLLSYQPGVYIDQTDIEAQKEDVLYLNAPPGYALHNKEIKRQPDENMKLIKYVKKNPHDEPDPMSEREKYICCMILITLIAVYTSAILVLINYIGWD